MKFKLKTISKEELTKIAAESDTLGAILKQFGLKPFGGNYKNIKRKMDLYNIDYSHIDLGFGNRKGKTNRKYL